MRGATIHACAEAALVASLGLVAACAPDPPPRRDPPPIASQPRPGACAQAEAAPRDPFARALLPLRSGALCADPHGAEKAYGEDADKPVRILSGGEKARVVLALMLYDPPNLLILDEPTNHLDMATKEMLVRALADYEGTMLFVSHDRRFLAQLSNRVLEITPDGAIPYGGGYLEYVAASGHEAPGLR